MDALRVVLIDPLDESREALQRLLQGLDAIWLAEVCKTYGGAERAVDEQAPDLVVIGLDADTEVALCVISNLAKQHPNSAILPASSVPDSAVILRTMRAGAREFLTLPANPADILDAVGHLVHTPAHGAASRVGGRIIAFAGAAGGVGCTSLAANTSATFARDARRSVALVEFDMFTGAIDACVDIVPNYTLLEVSQNADRLDLTLLKRSMARHSSGLYVLPRPASLEDTARVDLDAMPRVLSLLKAAFSLVVIDTSKALHPSDFAAYETADVIVLVVQLDIVGLRNTARLVQVFRQSPEIFGKLKLVVNRLGMRDCQIQQRKAEELLGLPVAWTVPDAPHEFAISRTKGTSLHTEFPRSKALRAIEELARGLVSQSDETKSQESQPVRRIAAMF
jgi:pilus assembly protein CpaE